MKDPVTSPCSSDLEISVVVPVRNEEDSVRALIEGLLNQTHPPSEIVITDGGSVDATTEIIEEFIRRGARVKLIREPDSLPGRSRNISVRHARGEWLAFIDAGNRPTSEWLASLAGKVANGSAVDVVYGSYDPVIDSFFKECAAIAYVPPTQATAEGQARPSSIVSALMRREVWQAVGGFPEHLRSAEDLLFLRKVEKAGFHIVRAPAAVVHWSIQPNLWRTFKRFVEYARNNIRAGLWREWQAAIFLQYGFIVAMTLPGFFIGPRWLALVPLVWFGLLLARAARALHRNRHCYPAGWARNLARLISLVPIMVTLDAAVIVGSINWLMFDKLRAQSGSATN